MEIMGNDEQYQTSQKAVNTRSISVRDLMT